MGLKLRLDIPDSNKKTPPSSPTGTAPHATAGDNAFAASPSRREPSGRPHNETQPAGHQPTNHNSSGHTDSRRAGGSKAVMPRLGHPDEGTNTDLCAASYRMSESGAFAMAGFELKESGITRHPDMEQSLVRLCQSVPQALVQMYTTTTHPKVVFFLNIY